MHLRASKVLLTGATGFLGRHAFQALRAEGAEVFALARPSSARSDLPDGLPPERVVTADTGAVAIARAVAAVQPDLIVHCAGRVLTDHRPEDVDDLVASNVLFFTALLEGMAAQGGIRIVNVGTYLEHSAAGDILPNSLYAATKRAALEIARFYAARVPLRIVTVKPSVIYGPGDQRPRLVRVLVEAAMTGRQLALSPGFQELDLIHVADAAAALVRAAQRVLAAEGPLAEEFLAVTGRAITLRALVAQVSTITGRAVEVQWGAVPYKETEVMRPYVLGPTLPGWVPSVALDQGLRQMLAEVVASART